MTSCNPVLIFIFFKSFSSNHFSIFQVRLPRGKPLKVDLFAGKLGSALRNTDEVVREARLDWGRSWNIMQLKRRLRQHFTIDQNWREGSRSLYPCKCQSLSVCCHLWGGINKVLQSLWWRASMGGRKSIWRHAHNKNNKNHITGETVTVIIKVKRYQKHKW